MSALPAFITPERWIVQLFAARAVAEGGVIRRKIVDVERLVGRKRFLCEVRRRGFHAIENADQFIVICNQDPLVVLT
jgi:hypothetical protein